MITTTLIKNETLERIKGPEGDLELAVYAHEENVRGPWGIVCHPHSEHGGTMYNKVVTTLVKTFQARGVNTVRFNFRGVGNSAGSFARGEGEVDDLFAVISWIQETYRSYDLWLAGFSFGAYVAAKAATKIMVSKLVLVAPPVVHFKMNELQPLITPPVVVQGEQDDVVPAEEVLAWANRLEPKATIVRIPEAGHFFHGKLQVLYQALLERLA